MLNNIETTILSCMIFLFFYSLFSLVFSFILLFSFFVVICCCMITVCMKGIILESCWFISLGHPWLECYHSFAQPIMLQEHVAFLCMYSVQQVIPSVSCLKSCIHWHIVMRYITCMLYIWELGDTGDITHNERTFIKFILYIKSISKPKIGIKPTTFWCMNLTKVHPSSLTCTYC